MKIISLSCGIIAIAMSHGVAAFEIDDMEKREMCAHIKVGMMHNCVHDHTRYAHSAGKKIAHAYAVERCKVITKDIVSKCMSK